MIHRFGPIGWTALILLALFSGQPAGPTLAGGAIGYAVIFGPALLEAIGESLPAGRRGPGPLGRAAADYAESYRDLIAKKEAAGDTNGADSLRRLAATDKSLTKDDRRHFSESLRG